MPPIDATRLVSTVHAADNGGVKEVSLIDAATCTDLVDENNAERVAKIREAYPSYTPLPAKDRRNVDLDALPAMACQAADAA